MQRNPSEIPEAEVVKVEDLMREKTGSCFFIVEKQKTIGTFWKEN
jgi:hypothetical protein